MTDNYIKKMKIGVFDSGYGGLTILKEIRKVLPQYNYMYTTILCNVSSVFSIWIVV